jgi:DNA-binding NarL/FixJ family response regulator
VLASGLVRELADLDEAEGDVWFDEEREVELRGLRGRHVVVPVRWAADERRPLRVVIADDAAIIRDGLAALLRESGLEVVATAGDADGLTAAVERHAPDVAIVDIRMPPTHTTEGLVAAESIRRLHPEIGVLVLSQHVEPAYALQLVRGGESRIGYLLKDRVGEAEMLLEAIRRVAHGGSVVDPSLTSQLLRRADAQGTLGELAGRERKVLVLLAEGLSNQAIAERLVVTDDEVEALVGEIFIKLGLRDETSEHRRVAAVLTYLRATGEA